MSLPLTSPAAGTVAATKTVNIITPCPAIRQNGNNNSGSSTVMAQSSQNIHHRRHDEILSVVIHDRGSLGMKISDCKDYIYVNAVFSGSVAEQAGILPGDAFFFPGCKGSVPFYYNQFLDRVQSGPRPFVFDVGHAKHFIKGKKKYSDKSYREGSILPTTTVLPQQKQTLTTTTSQTVSHAVSNRTNLQDTAVPNSCYTDHSSSIQNNTAIVQPQKQTLTTTTSQTPSRSVYNNSLNHLQNALHNSSYRNDSSSIQNNTTVQPQKKSWQTTHSHDNKENINSAVYNSSLNHLQNKGLSYNHNSQKKPPPGSMSCSNSTASNSTKINRPAIASSNSIITNQKKRPPSNSTKSPTTATKKAKKLSTKETKSTSTTSTNTKATSTATPSPKISTTNEKKPLAASSSATSKAAATIKPKKKKLTKRPKKDPFDWPDEMPNPGCVSEDNLFYVTLKNESIGDVADKVGCDWKDITKIKQNQRFGINLRRNTAFQEDTILKLPAQDSCSKWKLSHLQDTKSIFDKEPGKCVICHKAELDPDTNPVLLCDGCDLQCHLFCTHDRLKSVPEQDWFCRNCCAVLQARQDSKVASNHNNPAVGQKTLCAALPKLAPLAVEGTAIREYKAWEEQLSTYLIQRQTKELADLAKTHEIIRLSTMERDAELPGAIASMKSTLNMKTYAYESELLSRFRIEKFVRRNGSTRDNDGKPFAFVVRKSRWETETIERVSAWFRSNPKFTRLWQQVKNFEETTPYKREMEFAEDNLESLREEQNSIQSELRNMSSNQDLERRTLQKQYDRLLDRNSKDKPRLLGRVTPRNDTDVQALNMLTEPDELVIFLSLSSPPPRYNDGNDARNAIASGQSYAVFALSALFDTTRDDNLPISMYGVRGAQQTLMGLLKQDNHFSVVSLATLPETVHLRGDSHGSSISSKLFDLGELVQDCNYEVDIPKEETPDVLVKNGLRLREYQKASLRWMLDKERGDCNSATKMGLAGELWDRMRFLDQDIAKGEDYYYCELTGTFALNIFDYPSEVGQGDAARNVGSNGTGGILGLEMGLGKTIVCLGLIVANPPKADQRVLPREHIWKVEKHEVNHPLYSLPPLVENVWKTGSKKPLLVSNGTLVIVPMTLLSQWEAEIAKFAPHLNVLTLHNSETPKHEEVAASDIVLASTFLLQQSSGSPKFLISCIKRTHWHRIIVDESHYNQTGQKIKTVLSSLSATHRHCVTGTPIGHSLDDLQGQIRFLRLPQFSRLDFWQNAIGNPYCDHNEDALRVLRSLLSRIVIRYSKKQIELGVELPPRRIETVRIPFGTDSERKFYEDNEKRVQEYFNFLRDDAKLTVASKFMELQGSAVVLRQATNHTSLVDLGKLDNAYYQRDRDRRGHGKDEKKKSQKSGTKSREDVLAEAIQKARKSRETRVRTLVMCFQEDQQYFAECPVCLDATGEKEASITPCGHLFCRECVQNLLSSASSTREPNFDCPSCRDRVTGSEVTYLGDATGAGEECSSQESAMKDEDREKTVVCGVNGYQMTATDTHAIACSTASSIRVGCKEFDVSHPGSAKEIQSLRAHYYSLEKDTLIAYCQAEVSIGTKISHVLHEIHQMIKNDQTSKCCIFSQFLGNLDILEQELFARGIKYVRVDGNKKQHERADALLEFSYDETIKVFLLSMRSGAVGLNLTSANHCFIMDPPMNSALEEQAIDRIHRIGQTRPVSIKRFVIQDTIEERILEVRRQIQADKPTASTDICDAELMQGEEGQKDKKKPDAFGRDIQRYENLAKLFGTTYSRQVVHKA